MHSLGWYCCAASCFLCLQTSKMFLWCFTQYMTDQAFTFKIIFVIDVSSLSHSAGPCVPHHSATHPPPPPPRSPCVRVPHLSFGCCADGSLLVLHNGSKVSVPHAINTHSNFSTPAVLWSICNLTKMIPLSNTISAVHECTFALWSRIMRKL